MAKKVVDRAPKQAAKLNLAQKPQVRSDQKRSARKVWGDGVKSVEVGFRVLEAVAEANGAQSLSQITKVVRLSSSSARRYLVSLVNAGVVQQDPVTHYYTLGEKAVRIGVLALGGENPLGRVIEMQNRLNRSLGETSILTVWGSRGPTVYNVINSYEPMYLSLRVGTLLPLSTAAAGLVFCSFMSRSIVDPLLDAEIRAAQLKAGDPSGPSSWPEMDQMIDEVRENGVAILERSFVAGCSAAAVPMLSPTGGLTATLAIIALTERFASRREKIVAELKAVASKFSSSLSIKAMK